MIASKFNEVMDESELPGENPRKPRSNPHGFKRFQPAASQPKSGCVIDVTPAQFLVTDRDRCPRSDRRRCTGFICRPQSFLVLCRFTCRRFFCFRQYFICGRLAKNKIRQKHNCSCPVGCHFKQPEFQHDGAVRLLF